MDPITLIVSLLFVAWLRNVIRSAWEHRQDEMDETEYITYLASRGGNKDLEVAKKIQTTSQDTDSTN